MDKKLTLHDVLTSKQFRVALLIASGLKNSEIARIMRTTEYTVKNITRELYDRSGCSNRVELALLLVHEAETGMYDRASFHKEAATVRALNRELDQEFALIELAVGGTRARTNIRYSD